MMSSIHPFPHLEKLIAVVICGTKRYEKDISLLAAKVMSYNLFPAIVEGEHFLFSGEPWNDEESLKLWAGRVVFLEEVKP